MSLFQQKEVNSGKIRRTVLPSRRNVTFKHALCHTQTAMDYSSAYKIRLNQAQAEVVHVLNTCCQHGDRVMIVHEPSGFTQMVKILYNKKADRQGYSVCHFIEESDDWFDSQWEFGVQRLWHVHSDDLNPLCRKWAVSDYEKVVTAAQHRLLTSMLSYGIIREAFRDYKEYEMEEVWKLEKRLSVIREYGSCNESSKP